MLRYEHGGDAYAMQCVALDFSVNTNPLGMPQAVRHALVSDLDAYSRYPDPHCRALTAALSEHLGVLPENLLCGNGAADLIFRICACHRPAHALTLAPTFSEYERPVRLFGGQITEYALAENTGYLLDDGLLAALTPGVDILFLCNPNNPTGRLVPLPLLLQIADKCRRNGTLLVVDECFMPFSDGASMLPLLNKYPNLLLLCAFTKLYALAGLRLGYLVASDTALLASVGEYGAQWSVSVPAQAAGLAALSAEPGWTEQTGALVHTQRALVTQQLSALGLRVFPSDTNYLLVKSETPLFLPLLRRGILVRDCSNFTGIDARFIRIGLKTEAQNLALIRAISDALHD